MKVIQINDELLYDELKSTASKLGADDVGNNLSKIGISAYNDVKIFIADMHLIHIDNNICNFYQSQIKVKQIFDIFLQHDEESLCSGQNCPRPHFVGCHADGPSISSECSNTYDAVDRLKSYLIHGWERMCSEAIEEAPKDGTDIFYQKSQHEKAMLVINLLYCSCMFVCLGWLLL